jgi:hypothetical protein
MTAYYRCSKVLERWAFYSKMERLCARRIIEIRLSRDETLRGPVRRYKCLRTA